MGAKLWAAMLGLTLGRWPGAKSKDRLMRDNPNHPDGPVGVAVIGLGVMGTRMLTQLSRHAGFTVRSVWDTDSSAIQAIAQEHADVTMAESAEEAMATEGVRLVYVATPPHAHHPYARMAIDANLAVFCEKPLAVDLAQGRELVDLSKLGSIPNAVNFPFAAMVPIDRIEAMIADGSLGEVLAVDVRLHFVPWPREWQSGAKWLADRADGGFLREVGSHFVFLIEKLFGPAAVVESRISYPADSRLCETAFSARLNCSGLSVSFEGSAIGVGPDVVELTIWGSEQSVRLSDWSDVSVSSGSPWAPEPTEGTNLRADSNARFFDDLRALIDGSNSKLASFDDALSVQRIVETIIDGPGS